MPIRGPFAIEAEFRAQPVEPVDHGALAVAELEGSDDRGDPELALSREWLRVDDEPRFALGSKDVLSVQILVDQHLLALGRRQLLERGDGRVDELFLERPPCLVPFVADGADPPAGLLD